MDATLGPAEADSTWTGVQAMQCLTGYPVLGVPDTGAWRAAWRLWRPCTTVRCVSGWSAGKFGRVVLTRIKAARPHHRLAPVDMLAGTSPREKRCPTLARRLTRVTGIHYNVLRSHRKDRRFVATQLGGK